MSQKKLHSNYLEFKIVIEVSDAEKENIIRFLAAAHGLSHRFFVTALTSVLLRHDLTSTSVPEDANCYFSTTLRETLLPEY